MNYTDKENVTLAKREYDNNKIGFESDVNKKYFGTLSDINNNRSNNGEQIFTYTKTENGRGAMPLEAPLSERAKVKEITLLYRGSTNPLESVTGKAGEVGRDWGLNNTVLGLKIGTGQRGVTGQLEASAEYLKEIMEKYPNAKINIYGHSLGSMDAQYALACITDYSRINGAYIYNGPNIYSLLSYNQKVNVSALYAKIYNYIDSEDIVGLGYEKGKGSVGQVFKFDGKNKKTENAVIEAKKQMDFWHPSKVALAPFAALYGYLGAMFSDQHMWGGYNFDADGNLIDRYGRRVKAWEKPRWKVRCKI